MERGASVPAKAEDEKGNAEEGGHGMPDERVGMSGTEVEAEPEGSGQGEQLARQEIHLCGETGGVCSLLVLSL